MRERTKRCINDAYFCLWEVTRDSLFSMRDCLKLIIIIPSCNLKWFSPQPLKDHGQIHGYALLENKQIGFSGKCMFFKMQCRSRLTANRTHVPLCLVQQVPHFPLPIKTFFFRTGGGVKCISSKYSYLFYYPCFWRQCCVSIRERERASAHHYSHQDVTMHVTPPVALALLFGFKPTS